MPQSPCPPRGPTGSPQADDPATWPGAVVRGGSGATLGHIDHVYVDRTSGRPTFAALTVPDAPHRLSLLPVEMLSRRGCELSADVAAETLARAPQAAGSGRLDAAREADVRGHYGLG